MCGVAVLLPLRPGNAPLLLVRTAALLGLALAIIGVIVLALTLTVTPLPRSLNCPLRFGTRSLASLPKLVGSLVVQLILLAAVLNCKSSGPAASAGPSGAASIFCCQSRDSGGTDGDGSWRNSPA